ncbi:SRPBCC domain-containing protein [Micromonospora sp. DT44]|uniref:SRPBCC domain-containing protein n=1 Tax=Micromonospora sp. DT44 TaxID=3393439 RepID=UPI003CE7785F
MTEARDLTVYVSSERDITMVRSFDAPRDLVFAAHTQAEHLKQWWCRGNPADTAAQRDGIVEAGMAQGTAESYAALDRHLSTMH